MRKKIIMLLAVLMSWDLVDISAKGYMIYCLDDDNRFEEAVEGFGPLTKIRAKAILKIRDLFAKAY